MSDSNILIYWNNGNEFITTPYYYNPQRFVIPGATLFLKNCYLTMDYLYSTKALELTYPDGTVINILEAFLHRDDKQITLIDGVKNQYDPGTDTITFYDNDGAMFRKNLKLSWTDENTGRVSSASLLGHEFIHAYHEQFHPDDYCARRLQEYPDWKKTFPHFPNEEEAFVTLDLGNQVIRKLGEDERSHYKRNYYHTISPISTMPAGDDVALS